MFMLRPENCTQENAACNLLEELERKEEYRAPCYKSQGSNLISSFRFIIKYLNMHRFEE